MLNKKEKINIVIGSKIAMFDVIDRDDINRRFILKCICGKILNRNIDKLRGGQIPICECSKKYIEPIIGQIVGTFTIIKTNVRLDNDRSRYCILICECGLEIKKRTHDIKIGQIPYCECTPRYKDLTGLIFGNVKVIGIARREKYKTKSSGKEKIDSRIFWSYECLKCGKIKETTSSNLKSGRIISCNSKECKLRGEQHPLWNPHRDRSIRNSKLDLEWSKNILDRDSYECVCCSNKQDKLEAHHLNGWNWCKEERLLLSNGVSLCVGNKSGCHYKFHKEYGRGNNTREQFEEFLLKHFNKKLDDVLK